MGKRYKTLKDVLITMLPLSSKFAINNIIENLCPEDVLGVNVNCEECHSCDTLYCWNKKIASKEYSKILKLKG